MFMGTGKVKLLIANYPIYEITTALSLIFPILLIFTLLVHSSKEDFQNISTNVQHS